MMPQQTSININSKYFVDRVENDIVQLARAVSLEYSVSIEEAKIMARKMIQSKLNQILTDDEKEGISNLSETTERMIKDQTGGFPIRNYTSKVYELLKTFDLI